MKNKFKFFNGFSPIERDPNNGVTDQYLIDLDDEIWGYSDWIIRTLLRKDIESGIECLHIEFKDIDGNQYMCTIYDDKSFDINKITFSVDGFIESSEYLDIPNIISSDSDNLLDYFLKMLNILGWRNDRLPL